jgi:hypothetical protein
VLPSTTPRTRSARTPFVDGVVTRGHELVAAAREWVARGELGYAVVIARRP